MEPLPLALKPGIIKNGTAAQVGMSWHDGHLMRWVLGRMRPILGWDRFLLNNPDGSPFAGFGSPIRKLHQWYDLGNFSRVAVLCERHLYVIEGNDTIHDITPAGGIVGPDFANVGGYGDDRYNDSTYGTPRSPQPLLRGIGFAWSLDNWGTDLLAMASSDGRLLIWKPGDPPGTIATAVPNAPINNRSFVVTPDRYVMLFGMGGNYYSFGWCSQEDIETWAPTDLNTAGSYEMAPGERILDARVARYSIIFWTTGGAYGVYFKGLPYVYTYEHLGKYSAPLSSGAAAVYAGNVMWPSSDGFWMYDGNSISTVPCSVLDWFQQTYSQRAVPLRMIGTFNGAASEIWWSFPSTGQPMASVENDWTMIYNFEERWWSIAHIGRTAGIPGSLTHYPVMASSYKIFRHETGNVYPTDTGAEELPWIQSGAINIDAGKGLATTKQLIVDTDADAGAVGYQLFSAKARYSDAVLRTKGMKVPSARAGDNKQGKVDYRLTGRDFYLRMQSQQPARPWSFGQAQLLLTPRGRRGAS
jgi:hypothetical protein